MMEQSIGERSDVPTCSASVPSTQSERDEAATTDVTATKEPNPGAAQTDFSVTSRLLHHVSPPPYTPPAVSASKHQADWHYHLPNDQGVVSSRHFWHGSVPNMTLPAPPAKQVPSQTRPPSNGHSSYPHASPADKSNLYTLYHAAMVHGPLSTDPQRYQLKHDTHYPHPRPYTSSLGMSYTQSAAGSASSGTEQAIQASTSPQQGSKDGVGSPSDSLVIDTPNSADSPVLVHGHQQDAGATHDQEGHNAEEEEDSGDDTDGESSFHSQSSHGGSNSIEEPKKPKRTRTAYSNYQLDQLELVFQQTQYPDVFLREELSNRLAIREDRIQVWFQNRRARFRKQERTGSVSHRARNRQRRLQKLIHQNHIQSAATMAMYAGYNIGAATAPNPQMMPLHSPQTTMPSTYSYMSGFPTLPSGQMPLVSPSVAATTSTSIEFPLPSTGSQQPLSTTSTAPPYLPSFGPAFRPAFCPSLSNYMPRTLPATNHNPSS